MGQKYFWASPDKVKKLTYPQLAVYLQEEYRDPSRSLTPRVQFDNMEDAIEYQRVQLAKKKQKAKR